MNGAGIREPSGREDAVLLGAGSCSLSWLRHRAKCFLPGRLSLFPWPPSIAFHRGPSGKGLAGPDALLISLLRLMELPALVFALGGECREGETGPWSPLISQACRCLAMAQNGLHQA